ncbi:MAG: hypothetical protein H7Y18_11020 [Clostridiaceae bacterium]|nr:hypothetical protein [Clostridiaceae bacterium]
MVAFKKMWEDVSEILSQGSVTGIDITEQFKSGFIVKENENTTFITREDFVDFWCLMLYFNEIDFNKLNKDGDTKRMYIYEVVKNLPYVYQEKSMLKLIN